jgi:hypothetical protein
LTSSMSRRWLASPYERAHAVHQNERGQTRYTISPALRCEIDAIFAHLYELEGEDLERVLDAQPPSESFRGLKQKELARWGEYRTQRLVLEAYDRLAEARARGAEYVSLVDPPPANPRAAHGSSQAARA